MKEDVATYGIITVSKKTTYSRTGFTHLLSKH